MQTFFGRLREMVACENQTTGGLFRVVRCGNFLKKKKKKVRNFKVMILVIPSPLMGREVVAHAGSTACLIPLQDFPSAVYPALHEHVYEPKVFWHTELTSQEWEPVVHSSKSEKKRTQRLL